LTAVAALAALPHLVFAAAPFGVFIAKPGGDLVARALEEAAVVASAAAAAIGAVILPARTLVTRSIPRLVTVICHIVLQRVARDRRNAGRNLRRKTNGRARLFLSERNFGAAKRRGETLPGQAIARGGFRG